MNLVTKTLFLSFFLTIVFLNIPNKSNFPKIIIIPLIVSLLVKYIIGDWDSGYKMTMKDIYYWTTIILTSYSTVLFFN
jgi:hypothetical protein